MGLTETVAVFLIEGHSGFSLIETGPGSTLPTIKKAIAELGFSLVDLKHIFLTHIHLDHAGAAGQLALDTGATVYVHERGAPHLIDPGKLLSSAQRIYGEQMDTLWGTMIPAPRQQIVALQGGEVLKLNDHQLQIIYTPGHALHHVSYFLDDEILFTGDSAGIRFAGSKVIRPALPPPEVDLEIWQQSIEAMLALNPKRLMLTHFGQVQDAQTHLHQVMSRNQTWAEEVLLGLQQKEDVTTLIKRVSHLAEQELIQDGADALTIKRHQTSSNAEMTVMGLTRYWTKFHPEKLV